LSKYFLEESRLVIYIQILFEEKPDRNLENGLQTGKQIEKPTMGMAPKRKWGVRRAIWCRPGWGIGAPLPIYIIRYRCSNQALLSSEKPKPSVVSTKPKYNIGPKRTKTLPYIVTYFYGDGDQFYPVEAPWIPDKRLTCGPCDIENLN
jgi:hypothetical protein